MNPIGHLDGALADLVPGAPSRHDDLEGVTEEVVGKRLGERINQRSANCPKSRGRVSHATACCPRRREREQPHDEPPHQGDRPGSPVLEPASNHEVGSRPHEFVHESGNVLSWMLSVGVTFNDDVEFMLNGVAVGASTGSADSEVCSEGDDSGPGFAGEVACRVTGAVIDDEYGVTVTPCRGHDFDNRPCLVVRRDSDQDSRCHVGCGFQLAMG